MSKPAEIQPLPSPHYWPLFEHMLKEHGLTLTDSEMHEIVQICRQLEAPRHPSPISPPRSPTQ
ncbi:MAG: hypothetical protein BWY57_02993 [Betaproteobacteria bacterium ADurb.Bin341]|nr:MAG: hypothetical protein BWY57_02993 [Betaproteobacteria bacterium ADurb.Bin341]